MLSPSQVQSSSLSDHCLWAPKNLGTAKIRRENSSNVIADLKGATIPFMARHARIKAAGMAAATGRVAMHRYSSAIRRTN